MTLPSGIFSPTVIVGASLGGVAGIYFQEHFNEDVSPSTFALLGVASLLAGVQRSTVSLCIILVEGTGKVELRKFSLPLLLVRFCLASHMI